MCSSKTVILLTHALHTVTPATDSHFHSLDLCENKEKTLASERASDQGREMNENKATIVFVLGGPGSGKGTQCGKISEQYGFYHLSAGDLLRSEVKLESDIGVMIQKTMNEGQLVPSNLMVQLLKRAMERSGSSNKFLVDGFPRDIENLVEFEKAMGIDPDLVLYLCCSEEVMVNRLLRRNEGREDDNFDTVKKRLKVFFKNTIPVIKYYRSKGKLQEIDAEFPVEKVFEEIKHKFSQLMDTTGASRANHDQNSEVDAEFPVKEVIEKMMHKISQLMDTIGTSRVNHDQNFEVATENTGKSTYTHNSIISEPLI